MSSESLRPISWNAADQLRDELRQYDPYDLLLDGRTAVESLRAVINAPKKSDAPVVITGGMHHYDSNQPALDMELHNGTKKGVI